MNPAYLTSKTLLFLSFGILDLAKLHVGSVLGAKIFNSSTASNISDDSTLNSFVTHSLQMTLLPAPCRFLVQRLVGQVTLYRNVVSMVRNIKSNTYI